MYDNITREEELKNTFAYDFFSKFDTNRIVNNIDFCVAPLNFIGQSIYQPLVWAEAKLGRLDLYRALTQLILTIGKAKMRYKMIPPHFLSAFNSQAIIFVEYETIKEVFDINDFDWSVTPSDHSTREFEIILNRISNLMNTIKLYYFDFDTQEVELRQFIDNLSDDSWGHRYIEINSSNFYPIYLSWREKVMNTINLPNWDQAREINIHSADFFIADLISENNMTTINELRVILDENKYRFRIKRDAFGDLIREYTFNDNQIAHREFWSIYKRPPLDEVVNEILSRRDLLIHPDSREANGAYFTPSVWVEKAHNAIAEQLGDNWQDEYYIWDCAAGTGNLLEGLTNRDNIWASTLDEADVRIMKEKSIFWEDHVFQFDFLNDDFNIIPQELQKIINSDEERKKLIIFINPPYVEVAQNGHGGLPGVNQNMIHDRYSQYIGTAGRELYALFFTRIYAELRGCMLAEFSTLKVLLGSAFRKFRDYFKPKLLSMFVVPGATFDNVNGEFPIGFKIWDTKIEERFSSIIATVFEARQGNAYQLPDKTFVERPNYINQWITKYRAEEDNAIGFLAGTNGNDIQNSNIVYILNRKEQMPNPRGIWINESNLLAVAVYFSVRKVIKKTWLNNSDQFLIPVESMYEDDIFIGNCLIYTIFHAKNLISREISLNNWIPFREEQLDCRSQFESRFMSLFISKFLNSEISLNITPKIFNQNNNENQGIKRTFSLEAQAVYEAGLQVWKYYISNYQNKCNYLQNASFNDIKDCINGINDNGNRNPTSCDDNFNSLIRTLNQKLGVLEEKIIEKVFEYKFLIQ